MIKRLKSLPQRPINNMRHDLCLPIDWIDLELPAEGPETRKKSKVKMDTPDNEQSKKERAIAHRLRIAVIDDEQKWLKVFQRMFRNSDYAVDTFDNPQTFVTTILEHTDKYAGIICDIKMPQMDGHQVYKVIKNNKQTRTIPFVIVSGVLTQDENLSRCRASPIFPSWMTICALRSLKSSSK